MVFLNMELDSPNNSFEQTKILKKYYKPDYSQLFNKIKEIKAPIKKEILIGLIDGVWPLL